MQKTRIAKEEIDSRRKAIYAMAGVVALFVFFVFMSLTFFGTGDSNTDFTARYNDYNDGWSVVQNGASEMKDLPLYVEMGPGESLILKKRLPSEIPKYSAIATRNYHFMMTVKVNGNIIYEYPEDWNEKLTIISDTWTVFNLNPSDYRGTIEITFKNNSSTGFSGYIRDIYYGEDNSIIQYLRMSCMWGFVSGLSLMLFGVILAGISLIYRNVSRHAPNVCMGIALLFFGLWLANRSKPPFFSGSNGRIFALALAALLLVAPFIFLYSYYRHDRGKQRSLYGFQFTVVFDIFLVGLSLVIRERIEIVIMIAYFTIFAAIINQGLLLHKDCFGPGVKFRNKNELLMDRIEFFSTAIFPFAGAYEIIFHSDELWSEISPMYRSVIMFYAGMYIFTILLRIYGVVKDRMDVLNRLQESQLELMMGQIQPHFIFNTLSSIRTLVRVDPDLAYDMLYDFSAYLRANIDNVTNLSGINFSVEVEHIKSYVNIEKVRFGDRLSVVYDLQETDFIVPPLSIQPLVENAIKHGVCKKIDGGTVTLKSYREGDFNIVEVSDDGIGINAEAASKLFYVYQGNRRVGFESTEKVANLLSSVVDDIRFLDEDGNPIEIEGPVIKEDFTGNGSEVHQSKGLTNIVLRLQEISNATFKVESMVGKGTTIRVFFPVKEEAEEADGEVTPED